MPAAPTHECTVTVLDQQQRRRKFVVFFKYDRQAGDNGAIKEMSGIALKGELIVMKHGDRCYVTGINRKADQVLAADAVSR